FDSSITSRYMQAPESQKGAVAKRKIATALKICPRTPCQRMNGSFLWKTGDENRKASSKTRHNVERYSVFVVVKP
ncbi:MAG: hypothetical protein ACOYIG_12790, partial [Acetivibrionales bacterium]